MAKPTNKNEKNKASLTKMLKHEFQLDLNQEIIVEKLKDEKTLTSPLSKLKLE
jgi:hypothetical protein